MAEFLLDYLDRTEKRAVPVYIPHYFSKVVRDAFKAEKREGQVVFKLFKKNEDDMDFFAILIEGSEFLRVNRRIKYRLDNNSWIHKEAFTSNEIKEGLNVKEVIFDHNGKLKRERK